MSKSFVDKQSKIIIDLLKGDFLGNTNLKQTTYKSCEIIKKNLNKTTLYNQKYYLNIIFEWLIKNICSVLNHHKITTNNKIMLFSLFNEYKEIIITNKLLLDMYEVILFHQIPYWSVQYNKKDFLLYRLIINSINNTPYLLPGKDAKHLLTINPKLRKLIEDFYSGMDNEFLNDFEIQKDKLLEYPISIVTYTILLNYLKELNNI